MTLEPVIVEIDGSISEKIEITEDMTPQMIEVEKGDLIRFRDNILTVPRDGMYKIGPQGVTEIAEREV